MPALASGLLSVFGALPSACLLLSPDFLIEAASDAYLTATATQRTDLLGRYVFDVFPDNPHATDAHAVRDVRASLEQVLATGQPHELPLQPYDLPDPAHPGQFVERYWQTRNAPVLDEQGRVAHIIHHVTDITAQIQAAAQLHESEVREQAATVAAEWQRGELARIFELKVQQLLESNVAERTRQLEAALTHAEQQRTSGAETPKSQSHSGATESVE